MHQTAIYTLKIDLTHSHSITIKWYPLHPNLNKMLKLSENLFQTVCRKSATLYFWRFMMIFKNMITCFANKYKIIKDNAAQKALVCIITIIKVIKILMARIPELIFLDLMTKHLITLYLIQFLILTKVLFLWVKSWQ